MAMRVCVFVCPSCQLCCEVHNTAVHVDPPPPRLAVLLQATGLALPGSDLDIVVLGVGATLTRAGTGFSKVQVCGLGQGQQVWVGGWVKVY